MNLLKRLKTPPPAKKVIHIYLGIRKHFT